MQVDASVADEFVLNTFGAKPQMYRSPSADAAVEGKLQLGDQPPGEIAQEEAPGGAGTIVGEIISALKDVKGDVTLTYDKASALPEGKSAGAFSWSGPATTSVHYGPQKSILFGSILGEALVEVRFFYNGKFINDFSARLLSAHVDKWTSSVEVKLTVDHIDPNPPGGIARIDWILSFDYSNITAGKDVKTCSGTAFGNGNFRGGVLN